MLLLHTLTQKQSHGNVTFNFLTEKGNHPQEDAFFLMDGENLNDIKMSDDGLEMLGEWKEPEVASILDIIEFSGYLEKGF